MTRKRPTRRPTRIRAALLLACAVTASCASTQEADEQEAVEASFSFTFEDGAEGWIAGFADYPVDFDPSIYELDSGHRPLPDGLEGHGLYIQGHNRSDDLFMFFKRQVGGLEPDAEYSAVLSLDLATNVAEGLVGIGGSPGESVFVKAGASTVEPVTPEDDAGYFRMNIDKGNQSNRGRVDGRRGARRPPRRDRRGVPHQDPRQLRQSGEGHRRRRGPAVADRRHRLRVRRA